MKLSATDIAGNKLETYIEDVRLDNKPPVVSVTEVRGTKRAADKSLANTYKVSVSDASGTGKFYYCFTPNGVLDEPAFNPDAALEQETGELETTFGKWAFIDQETAEKARQPCSKSAQANRMPAGCIISASMRSDIKPM